MTRDIVARVCLFLFSLALSVYAGAYAKRVRDAATMLRWAFGGEGAWARIRKNLTRASAILWNIAAVSGVAVVSYAIWALAKAAQ